MRAVSAQFQGDWRHHVEVSWTGSVAAALSAGLLWRVNAEDCRGEAQNRLGGIMQARSEADAA